MVELYLHSPIRLYGVLFINYAQGQLYLYIMNIRIQTYDFRTYGPI
jgi:hypothetical protein